MSKASQMHEIRPSAKPGVSWLWKMAWRDSRKSRGRLLLFMASIVLGIASLVAINSFGDNLANDIDGEAKALIGADLVLNRRATPDDSVKLLVASFEGEKAEEKSFASMIFFPKTEDSRLIQVRAIEGGFPFYGELLTEPVEAGARFKASGESSLSSALVDQSLLLQFNAQVGDSIRVGNGMYEITGSLLQAPGQSGIAATAAPVVYISSKSLEGTGLIRKGSRIRYKYYYKFPEGTDVPSLVKEKEDELNALSMGSETVEDRKESLGNAFEDLTSFLNLVAFIALLLGCVGVASAVYVYMRDKIVSVATLRCLGVSGQQAFMIFVIQVAAIGLIGSVIGAILGSFLQYFLPLILKDFLPFEATIEISPSAILGGIVTGLITSILFSLPPLIRIRKVSPLNALRLEDSLPGLKWDGPTLFVSGLILAFIIGFAWIQTSSLAEAVGFTVGIGISFLILAGVSILFMKGVRKYFPSGWSYLWRQSLANLYRPNNQTLILIVSIGLGTALICTLYLTQGLLLEQVNLSGSNDRPNLVLFDIQTNEKEEIRAVVDKYNLPVRQDVAVVTARLSKLHGMDGVQILEDTVMDLPKWVPNAEYRITFRDTLTDSEEIVKGEWRGTVANPGDSIFISLDEEFAKERWKVDIGDRVDFDVQGAIITTYVGSFREIDFARFQTNFLILFPTGVLERAPQFHVLVTRTDSTAQAAAFQREIMKEHPTVSIIDLGLVLKTVEKILDQVSFVIRFMAFISIATGILVLISSVVISRFQRIQESVLLRTIGANKRQILAITFREYFLLGLIATSCGFLISIAGSWALAYFTFEVPFRPDLLPVFLTMLGICTMVVVVGLFNIRGILSEPPLEVLRKEVA